MTYEEQEELISHIVELRSADGIEETTAENEEETDADEAAGDGNEERDEDDEEKANDEKEFVFEVEFLVCQCQSVRSVL